MRASRLAVLAGMLVAALVAVGCGGPRPVRPVRIESNEALSNLFPSSLTWQAMREDGEPQGLLMRDGDLVIGEGQPTFQYVAGDGPALNLTSDTWSTRLSGRIVTVSLQSDSAWGWLNNASRRELAGLRLLAAPESIDQTLVAAFKRLAAVNPNVGLETESKAALLQILPLIQPRVLVLSDLAADLRRYRASLRRLETLHISASDSGSLNSLPELPRLRRLMLGNWDPEKAGLLPAGIKGLRSLVVVGGDAAEVPSALRAAPAGLEELSLTWMDDPLDLTQLPDLPALRTLILNGSEVSSDLSGLASLKKLQWVGLPKNIAQRQFAALVAMHPNLKTLEIVGADSVTDLSPLRGLKRLEGLVLTSPYENLEALKGLTSLRFLGLYGDTTLASREQWESIRKSLPDALVVPVAPVEVCLGSGWILFLIPVTAVFWFLGSRARKPRATDARDG